MKSHLLISIFLISQISCSKIPISNECLCNQIFTQLECKRKQECIWDQIQMKCQQTQKVKTLTYTKRITNNENQIIIQPGRSLYCNQIQQAEQCQSAISCAWIEKKCTHFTTCSAFDYKSAAECSSISNRCTSDGDNCVERNVCKSYFTESACVINQKGKFCYWKNIDTKSGRCYDIKYCSQLPISLTTDSQCRFQLPQCTAKIDGGCIESGENCSDQISEISCVTNRSGDQQCFWMDDKCLDKICENAPLKYISDQECKSFLSICTTKQHGGCTQRNQCSDALIEAACITDINNYYCQWDGTSCNNRKCQDALQSYQTNQQCSEYLQDCITTGNGCILNTGCGAAQVKQACDKTLTGILCHWDGSKCTVKTCENAGPLYVGHNACNHFIPNCTERVNASSGCMLISCLSAPTINDTNELCDKYLPNHNCITKYGGGCKVNTTCENIDIEIACEKDINNKECFWDNGCKQKTCANAPRAYNSYQLCRQYSKYCTIGQNQRCVDLICENVLEKKYCIQDFNTSPCLYVNVCKDKTCSMASKSFKTNEQCIIYLPTCILDNSGVGCMDIPDECNSIKLRQTCLSNEKLKCAWVDENCIGQTCYTAPQENNATKKCQLYKSGCVVNNDQKGCMDLPDNCQDRKRKDNCQIESNKCQWDPDQLNCFDVKCENAHLVSLLDDVTQEGCWNYFSLKCIINNAQKKCKVRPTICNNLNNLACNQENVLTNNENCYWDPVEKLCKPYLCSSITFAEGEKITHEKCNYIMEKCTIKKNKKGCKEIIICEHNERDKCVDECFWNSDKQVCQDNLYDVKSCEEVEVAYSYGDCQQYSSSCTINQKRCILKKPFCNLYTNIENCQQNSLVDKQQCQWNEANEKCIQKKKFDCSLIKGTGLTAGYCRMINPLCSVNFDRTQCLKAQDFCSSYTKQDCVWARLDHNCTMKNLLCIADCAHIPGPEFDVDYCKNSSDSCTVKFNGSGCVNKATVCADSPLVSCTMDLANNYCYPQQVQENIICIVARKMPLLDCTSVTSTKLSPSYCSAIGPNCSINATLTQCIQNKELCSDYQPNECWKSQTSECTFLNEVCTNLMDDEFICQNIKIFGTNYYTDYLCKLKKDTCRANSDKSGCILNDLPPQKQQCSSFTGTNLTYYYCVDISVDCSINKSKTACINAQTLCEYYSISDCAYSSEEGECIIENNKCVQQTCKNAPITAKTDANCLFYSTNCIRRQGGCETKSNCESYYDGNACITSLDGKRCLWNQLNKKCVLRSCANAEVSIYFDSYIACADLGDCTIRVNPDGTLGQGCIPLAGCDTYRNIEQCKLDDKRRQCEWNTNEDTNFCELKSCSSASKYKITHEECMEYLPNCTVNIINSQPSGCISLRQCDQYTTEAQCQISSFKDGNDQNIVCGWNGLLCANKSCLTANYSINNPFKCATYYPNCTVNQQNNGCIQIPKTCEEMTQIQCFDGSMDLSNRKCLWLTNKCIVKQCKNVITTSNCESALSSCTFASAKCITGKPKVCSDFQYTNDIECQSAIQNGNCTTNGLNCVNRGLCQNATHKAGCTKDINEKICEWVIGDDQSQICAQKSCVTASKTLTTEKECSEYFPTFDGAICTTKKNGGCVIKGTCETLTIEEICDTDAKGKKCIWDKDLFLCRYPSCQEFNGASHQECYLKSNNCTIGLNGKCTHIDSCENIKEKELCFIGNHGPCIWIFAQPYENLSQGGCFKYDSCQSLRWKTDQQCKQISPYCTTNGIECIGIKKCSKTNTKGGCLIGTDGICVQTPIKAGDSNLICKKFTTCHEIFYLIHNECQKANSNCTSDYVKGCIPLSDCQTYTNQGSCKINKLGIGRDQDSLIVTTGNCVWDKEHNICRDEQCQDIYQRTEIECSSKLSNCTSDGKKCLLKEKCSTYQTEDACNIAGGTDGPCTWIPGDETNPGLCRTKVCDEIQNGSSQEICAILKDCVTDGQNCISRGDCSSYLTQIACQSTGLDDACIWVQSTSEQQGKCQRMTGCTDAKDQFKCDQVKERCYWQVKENNCADHTCETFQIQEKKCTYFQTWDKQSYNICSLIEGKCISFEVQSLTEDNCFNLSGKLYTWSSELQKCVICEKVIHNEEQSENKQEYKNLNELMLALIILRLFLGLSL